MSAKRIGVIAAATSFLAFGALLCLARPVRTLAVGAAGSPTAEQNPRSYSGPVQANPSQQAPSAPAVRTQDQSATRSIYQPAQAVSAAEVEYPLQTAAQGIVVFNVSLNAAGAVGKVTAVQGVPPLTAVAQHSLRGWKFTPASQDRKAEDSEMLVAFVFRHAVYTTNPPRFTPIARESGETPGGFIRPGIVAVAYAAYPASTIASGAVVVQANVKTDGSTGGVSVVRDLPGGFGPLAIKAAKQWEFQAALRDGKPVPSKVAIAFVFSSRSLNPF